MAENTVSNEVATEDDHSHTNDSRSQKKITKKKQRKNKNSKFVTKYSDSMTRLADVKLSNDQSSELKEIPLPSLSISKSRSMSDVRESGFKRRAKQVQTTTA